MIDIFNQASDWLKQLVLAPDWFRQYNKIYCSGSKAHTAGLENKVKNLELKLEEERIGWGQEKDALIREKQDNRDKIESLKFKLKQVKQVNTCV